MFLSVATTKLVSWYADAINIVLVIYCFLWFNLTTSVFSYSPTPAVTWTRLDADLPGRAESASNGQEIVIKQVHHEDAGWYRCSAKNSNSSQIVKKDIELAVECKSVVFYDNIIIAAMS